MNINSIEIKNKIYRDLHELSIHPIEGIGILLLPNNKNNIQEFIINIRLMSGIFEGYYIQILMRLSENFPFTPPQFLIFPNQLLYFYHNYIFHSNIFFNKDTFNIIYPLINYQPNNSFREILIQVQKFLSDPHGKEELIKETDIDFLFESMKTYKMTYFIQNEKKQITKIAHTWEKPYPPIYLKYKCLNIYKRNKFKKQKIIHFEINKNINYKNEIYKSNNKNKSSIISNLKNSSLQFGYIILNYKYGEDMILFPEIFSFKFYEDLENNKTYIFWIPIYKNYEHFLKNINYFINNFCKIKYGSKIPEGFYIKLEYLFEVISNILKSILLNISKKIITVSDELIQSFYNFIFMFKDITYKYKKIYNKYIGNILDNSLKEVKNLENEINTPFITKILHLLILLLFKTDPNCKEINELKQYLKLLKQRIYLKEFHNNVEYEMNYKELFIEDLNKYEIFNKIVDNISLEKNNNNSKISKNLRKRIIFGIYNDFKEIYNKCSSERKTKIDEIIMNNLNFSDYFDLSSNKLEENLAKMELPESFYSLKLFLILKNKINQKGFFAKLKKNNRYYFNTEELIEKILRISKEQKAISNSNEHVEIYFKIIYDILFLEIFLNSKNENNYTLIYKEEKVEKENTKNKINSFLFDCKKSFDSYNKNNNIIVKKCININFISNYNKDNNKNNYKRYKKYIEYNNKKDNNFIFQKDTKEINYNNNDSSSIFNSDEEEDNYYDNEFYHKCDEIFFQDIEIQIFRNKEKRKKKKYKRKINKFRLKKEMIDIESFLIK